MKKITFLLLAIAMTTTSVFAQQKRDFKKQHKTYKIGIIGQLNLSDQQKQQAKQYRIEYKKQLAELNKNENITVKEYRDRKAALHKEQKAKFDNLLTAEQKAKIDQLKADRKTKAEEDYAKKLDKMKTSLQLTDQQMQQMKDQRTAMQAKFKAIKENESLSVTEKKEQMTALKAEAKEKHKKIFTAEQLKKLEEMKKKRMEKVK